MGKLIFTFVISVPVGLFEAFVALMGWRWFIVEPGLSDKPLNVFIFFGISLLINLLFKSRTVAEMEKENDIEDILKISIYGVIYALVAWGLMALIHLFV